MSLQPSKITKVELQLNGVWTDITRKVRVGEGITITRGRADEASQVDPSSCSLTLDNRDGRFSPRNPTGPYYGVLGRNTPLRVSVLAGGRRLTSDVGGWVSTPDSAGLSITGDIDVRFDARIGNWANAANMVYKEAGAGQRSWWFYTTADGYLRFEWSSDGTTTSILTSRVPLRSMTGRQAVRVTLDVNNGAGGRTATFYTAPTAAGPWEQLGDPVTAPGTTSIFDSTAQVRVNVFPTTWEIYSAEIRNGIGGSLVANPVFSAQAEGASSVVDAQGNTWTIPGTLLITNRRYRFHGEVSTWPVEWGPDERNIRTLITASGITRRLGQGASPLQSPLRRALPAETGLVAYWPMEDDEGSTSLASGMPGGASMRISGPQAPELASDDQIKGSLPLPVLNGAVFSSAVPAAAAGTISARCVIAIPAAGDTGLGEIMRVHTTGTNANRWIVYYAPGSGGTIATYATDAEGNTIGSVGFTHTNANGRKFIISLELTTSGSNVQRRLTSTDLDTDSGLVATHSITSSTVGRATAVYVNSDAAAPLVGTVVGHVHLMSALASNPYGFEDYARGWVPETPGRRVARLCSEEGVPFVARGDLGPAAPQSAADLGSFQGMGPQTPDDFLTIIGKAVDVDLGMLVEPRTSLAIGYRPRESLYGQDATLALDYSLLSDLEPVEDDQAIRNDITVTREGGSSARVQQTTGPLSVQAPPAGVGIYDDAVDLNVATDAQLEQQASWRLHLGTVDEARYPTITIRLAHPKVQANAALVAAALDIDQGDLLTIANPPAWVPPETIRQIAQGFTEEISDLGYDITINCTPASPWDAGLYDVLGRYSADGATLSAGITSTATGAGALSIVTPAGKPLWTSNPADFPLDIMLGGERLTLSAIAATASPQSATVSARSVNGVVKSHAAGTALDVADPIYWAL